MANRTCDDCGESFQTLTKLRLHDCPGGDGPFLEALLPEPQPEELPERIIETDEFQALKDDDRIDSVINMMDFPLPDEKEAISFLVEIDGHAYGLHCDHETAEWDIIAEGDDTDRVRAAHSDWVSNDVEKVTGSATDPEVLDNIEVPDEITTDCSMCGGTHELTAQPESITTVAGVFEYEGFCEETGNPVIVTKSGSEFIDK